MLEVDKKFGLFAWFGAVDESMQGHVLSSLLELNETDHKKLTFVLSTHGGDAHIGFALYDLIKGNPKPVRIIVNGYCGSAGTLILQGAAERLIFPQSYLLVHFGEQGGSSHAEFAFDRKQHARWVDLMTEATAGKTSRSYMDQMHRGETYLNAHEAVELGLVDRVVKTLKTEILRGGKK